MKASGTHGDLSRAMVDVARGDEVDRGDSASETGAAQAELALSDLVGDANGEVVIFNDSGFRTMLLRSEAAVIAEGEAAKHVTAGGDDVSGFKYLTFDNGVTVYFPEGLDLILRSASPRPTG